MHMSALQTSLAPERTKDNEGDAERQTQNQNTVQVREELSSHHLVLEVCR